MDIESIKTFCDLAKTKKFSKTAENMFVSQSTVSNRIKDIESELGEELIVRGKNKSELSPAGNIFLEYAEKIINDIQDAENEIQIRSKFSCLLRIAAPHLLQGGVIFPLIFEYNKNHPTVAISISASHSSDIIRDMRTNNYDLVFSYFPYSNPNYICEPFLKDRVVLAAGSRNDVYKDGICLSQLKTLPLIYTDILSLENEWILPHKAPFPIEIDVESFILPYLKQSNYYSFLSYTMIKEEIQLGNIIEIPIKDINELTEPYYIIYKKCDKTGNIKEMADLAKKMFI